MQSNLTMEIQDSDAKSNPIKTPNPYPDPNPSTREAMLMNAGSIRGGPFHRRAHSEVTFRMTDNLSMTMMMDLDPISRGGSSTTSMEEIGSEDDLFSTYIDVDKLTGGSNGSADQGTVRNCTDQSSGGGEGGGDVDGGDKASAPSVSNTTGTTPSRPKHRHSNSVDGGISAGEILEAKKAMPPDKLAELWTVDPKRAKRILANRQSAARSKERKARYILELERKVQTLQTEATTLSAQLTLFQRDTTGLTTENTELKLRLQAMEQQAQLRDALNEALRKEVQRLKIATGELMSTSDSFDLGMPHQMPHDPSSFLSVSQQPGTATYQNLQLPQFSLCQSGMPVHHPLHLSNSNNISDLLQNDSLGRLQGLDINGKGSNLVKSEGPSLSTGESGTTY